MANKEKADVFQNVSFTALKKQKREDIDVEFQGTENDPSAKRSTVKIQDNEHTKSKLQRVLQSKRIWIGKLLLPVLILCLIAGVVYSVMPDRSDSKNFIKIRIANSTLTAKEKATLIDSLYEGYVEPSDMIVLLDALQNNTINSNQTFEFVNHIKDNFITSTDMVSLIRSLVKGSIPAYALPWFLVSQEKPNFECNNTCLEILLGRLELEGSKIGVFFMSSILGNDIDKEDIGYIDVCRGGPLTFEDIEIMLDNLELYFGNDMRQLMKLINLNMITSDQLVELLNKTKNAVIELNEFTRTIDYLNSSTPYSYDLRRSYFSIKYNCVHNPNRCKFTPSKMARLLEIVETPVVAESFTTKHLIELIFDDYLLDDCMIILLGEAVKNNIIESVDIPLLINEMDTLNITSHDMFLLLDRNTTTVCMERRNNVFNMIQEREVQMNIPEINNLIQAFSRQKTSDWPNW